MLIKITDKCSLNCTHCMSSCTPDGKHMSKDTLDKALEFQIKYGGLTCLISGGEPTEHPDFIEFINHICKTLKNQACFITVTTNGFWLTENQFYVKKALNDFPRLIFQVVVDDRYYPKHVNELSPVFTYSNVFLCRNIDTIYPQGRALANKLPYKAKASKCFNVRAITKQLPNESLKSIINILNSKKLFCTPNIDINGSIILGESSLCPPCSSIYKSEKEIIHDIIGFQCRQCDFINELLPDQYKSFVCL